MKSKCCLAVALDAHVIPTQSCHGITILLASGLFKLHLHAALGCCVLQQSQAQQLWSLVGVYGCRSAGLAAGARQYACNGT